MKRIYIIVHKRGETECHVLPLRCLFKLEQFFPFLVLCLNLCENFENFVIYWINLSVFVLCCIGLTYIGVRSTHTENVVVKLKKIN